MAASDETATHEVTCTGGRVAIGGGARILGGATDDAPAGVVVVASYPVGVSGTPQAIWKAEAMELVATDAEWRLEVRAVCADAADQ